MRSALRPLRVRPFPRLFASYTLNELGDVVGLVALALLVYDQTGDPLATAALFLAAQFVPALISPLLTPRVDQLPLRRLLPAMYLAEAAIFAVLAWLATSFALWAALALTLVDGVLMLTARGITRAAVSTTLAPSGQLRAGNGLMNVGFAAASVGGAALGGLLVHAFGASTALLVDAASFVAVAALLAAGPLPGARVERSPWAERLREGMRFMRRDPLVRLLLAGETLAVLLFTLVVPIEVVYAKETLDASDAGYGLLLASWGAGIVLGSVVFLGQGKRASGTLIIVSTGAIGLAYLGMGATTSLAVACGASIVGGVGNGIQWVSVMTAIQEATPADLQARVTGFLESATSAVTGVGFVAGGVVVAVFSPPVAFLVAGSGVLALTAVAAAAPSMRALTSGPRERGEEPPRPPRRPAAPSGGA